ncbi:MAG: ABC transporter substrate-binding protein [Intestinimonas sp.]|nr:ABC transporter substrate-binding protein [Intestinimonas sp.]
MKRKKWLALTMACALSITLLAGCGSSNSAGSTPSPADETGGSAASDNAGSDFVPITFYGVIDPQVSAQQIIADKMGYFKDEGLDVTCQYVQSGTDISPLIAGGTAQVSCETTYTDIPLAASGVGVKALAPVCNIGDTQCVVASAASNIKSSKDIEGKRIGMASGSGVLMAIKAMCQKLDVDFDSLEFVNLSPADQISAMASGDIDIMACWQPWVNNAVDAGGHILFSGMHSYLDDYTQSVDWLNFYSTVQVTDSFLADHPKECEAILRAMSKATDYINNNMEDAAGIIADQLQLEKNNVLSIMKMNVYDMSYTDAFADACDSMAKFMLEQGNIDSIPDLSAYTDSTPLKNAVPELVTTTK